MASTIRNTTLTVGALCMPVALRKVSEKKEIMVGRAARETHAKVERHEIDSATGEKLTTDDIIHGVWEGDTFCAFPEGAMDAIKAETTLPLIDVESFIPLKDVPWSRATAGYYLAVPKGSSAKPLALLAAALRKKKVAGITKLCPRDRQHLAVIHEHDGGLFVTTLTWAEDWTQAGEAAKSIEGVTLDKSMIDVACNLIDAMTPDDPIATLDAQVDDVRALKAKLVEDALTGVPIEATRKGVPVSESKDLLEDMLATAFAAATAKTAKKSKAAAA